MHDDRYTVPTFYRVTVADDRPALALAEDKLCNTAPYRRVDIFNGEQLVGAFNRDD